MKADAFYGWPWSYWGQHVDPRVMPQRPELVRRAILPDYSLGSHVAPLGLAFGTLGRYTGAFVGEHGSWDRGHFNGYKVAFIPFRGGKPAGPPLDLLAGFLDGEGHARGRPVGVAFEQDRRAAGRGRPVEHDLAGDGRRSNIRRHPRESGDPSPTKSAQTDGDRLDAVREMGPRFCGDDGSAQFPPILPPPESTTVTARRFCA